MLTASLVSGQRVHAFESQKSDGPFTCPACLCQTILKRGRVKIPHFAHEPGVNCPESQGETPLHLQTKLAIYKALCASNACGIGKCGLEIRLTLGKRFQVADILARIGSELVAIEIQRSIITPEQIAERTLFYTERDITTLWVVPRVKQTDWGGGYHKTLKTYKCPNTWGNVDPCSFTTVRRSESQDLPRCLLWLHKPTLDKLQDIRKASKK